MSQNIKTKGYTAVKNSFTEEGRFRKDLAT